MYGSDLIHDLKHGKSMLHSQLGRFLFSTSHDCAFSTVSMVSLLPSLPSCHLLLPLHVTPHKPGCNTSHCLDFQPLDCHVVSCLLTIAFASSPPALGSYLEQGVVALMYPPSEYDARELHDAMKVRERLRTGERADAYSSTNVFARPWSLSCRSSLYSPVCV